MRISALVQSSHGRHDITLSTNDQTHSIQIAPKATGFGSSTNGGELLFLALATCYCNDLYREAAKRGVGIERVEVRVSGDFGAEGEPGRNVTFEAKVWARAAEAAIVELMQHTDRVAEVQNTLRAGTAVTLGRAEAVAV
jgi:organic hydroperoxide reductase OsmC/OhrA